MSVSVENIVEKIERLSAMRSQNTTLITYHYPAGYSVEQAKHHVISEQCATSNIKDRKVGKSVSRSLSSILTYLKTLKAFPSTGLIVCVDDQSYV